LHLYVLARVARGLAGGLARGTTVGQRGHGVVKSRLYFGWGRGSGE
jgi:hypothetical protein